MRLLCWLLLLQGATAEVGELVDNFAIATEPEACMTAQPFTQDNTIPLSEDFCCDNTFANTNLTTNITANDTANDTDLFDNTMTVDLEEEIRQGSELSMKSTDPTNLTEVLDLTVLVEANTTNKTHLSQNETTHNDLIGSFDETLTNLTTGTSPGGKNGSEKTDDEGEISFMSFEEWKRKNAAENPVKEKAKATASHSQPQQPQQFVGPLSEDIEIPLDMFGGQTKQVEDEGGKTYKDRFNYASFDCAATIMKTNSEAKGASAILNENKDSYLLNECSAPNKFVVIELCEDILVDTVLLGNYEFFSSSFKTIRLSVSDRFPVPQSGWKVLGEFEAENIRDLQTFSIKNPLIWARYLRLEVLSYFGDEYYCPLSAVRVYGKTMMEEFKLEEEKAVAGEHVEEMETEQTVETEELSEDPTAITSVVDMDHVTYLDEECSVALQHLGLDQFLEKRASDEVCEETDFTAASTATDSPAQEPTTQESIYKSISKRLSLLESNASLSLLYIEEQSKLLSKAFEKMEKRQITKFDLLVSAFNISTHSQLTKLKDLYTSFQEETSGLLKNQRESHARVLSSYTKQVDSLTAQLASQRRLGWLNTIVIVCLLIYVVVTRDTFIETEILEDGDYSDGQSVYSTRSASPSPTISTPATLPKKRHKIRLSIGHKIARSYSDYFYDKGTQQHYVYSRPSSPDSDGIRVELNPAEAKVVHFDKEETTPESSDENH